MILLGDPSSPRIRLWHRLSLHALVHPVVDKLGSSTVLDWLAPVRSGLAVGLALAGLHCLDSCLPSSPVRPSSGAGVLVVPSVLGGRGGLHPARAVSCFVRSSRRARPLLVARLPSLSRPLPGRGPCLSSCCVRSLAFPRCRFVTVIMCNPWLDRQARDDSVPHGPSSNARLVLVGHDRLATFIMSDNLLRIDKVMDRVFRTGEPEWRTRGPPRFIRNPKTPADLTDNFRRYVTGYPWMALAQDQAGYMRYHCGICRKVATISHILSDYHISRTSTHFCISLGHTIPTWMGRSQGFNTRADPTEVLFNPEEDELRPEVCDECNCNPDEAHEHGCHLCRPSAAQASADTGGRSSFLPASSTDRWPLPGEGQTKDARGATRQVKLTVAPSPCQDYRQKPGGGNSLHQTRSDQRHQAAGRDGVRNDKDYTNPALDPQIAMTMPRCPDEPRLRGGYVRDMDKYHREHKRLFSLDHFSPYGPWPTDFTEWAFFAKGLYKSSNGATSMDTIIDQGSVRGSIVITPSKRWELSPKVGDMIVISRCHPALDRITAGPVTQVGRQSFNIEWQAQ